MGLAARLRSFWRSTRHRADMEQDLSEELQFHLAQRAEDLARRQGLSPEAAMRAARLEFGSIERYKEETRQSRGLAVVDDLRGDVRYAWRTFLGNKGFTAAAVLTLALGIGANTAVFTLLDSVLLRFLPVDNPEQLIELQRQEPGQQPSRGFTNAIWEAIRDQHDVFAGVFAWSVPQRFELAQNGITENVDGLVISGGYFPTLGIEPAAGRLLGESDDSRGCPAVAVLSHRFWQTRFGAANDVVGRVVTLHRQAFQVVGVSGAGFDGVEVGRKFDVAVPLCASALFDKRNLDSRGRWWLGIMGRPKAGMTPDHVRARLEVLSAAVMRAAVPAGRPDNQQRFLQTRLVATSAATGPSVLRRTFGEPLQMLMAAVAIVLLIASANLASLMLARASTRAREIAIRTAVGASRRRLVRQLLTESVLLSTLGAALGLVLAKFGTALLVRNLGTGRNPVFVDVSPNGRILGFTVVVAVSTGILVGLLPALRSTAASAFSAMKSAAAGGGRRSRFVAGKWIVAVQLALSLVLLFGGGLLLRTFVTLLTIDPGFDRQNVLVIAAQPPTFAADTVSVPIEQRTLAFEAMATRLRALPGVVAVARSFTTPMGDDNWLTGITADVPNAPGAEPTTAFFNFVAGGYFATLRMPLLAGRDFDARDTKPSPPVAIVNQAVVRRFFPGVDPIGRTLRRRNQPQPVEIVGVVKDSKYESLRDVAPLTVFLPATQAPGGAEAQEFVVRTSTPPQSLLPSIQRAMSEVNADIPLRFRTLDDDVADHLVRERLLAALAAFFGGAALVLAMVGLYGVLNYLVTERQTEFGVRMALGARPASILRLVMREIVLVLVSGMAAGLVLALAAVRVINGMLYGLEPHDPVTMVVAVGLLFAVALVAAFLPARRATRVDPLVALRSE